MSDEIFIDGLRLQATVGVYDWEREAPRELRVDLRLTLDLRAAAASDALADTVDYDAVAGAAKELAGDGPFQLVEHYAGRLADRLLAITPAVAIEVTVHKPGAVADTQSVGVRLRRRRGGS